MRGEVYELRNPKGAVGHEQKGKRYAVVVQAVDLTALSTWIVCPLSASAQPAAFRPVVLVMDKETHVMTDQVRAVDPNLRLGHHVGRLTFAEMQSVDAALKIVMGLR